MKENRKTETAVVGLLSMCLFCFMGCEKATPEERTSLGKITDANVIPTSFNECQKTMVKTEMAAIIIRSLVSVEIGKEAYSTRYSDGTRWFSWDGSGRRYRY